MSKALEAAVKAAQNANIIKWHPGDFEDTVMASDIAPIITAFLDAAAGDAGAVERGREIIANGCGCDRNCEDPHSDGYCGCRQESKAAILALKEAVNGA